MILGPPGLAHPQFFIGVCQSPPVNQRRATSLFRVREGPSPRSLRANVNGKNWGGRKRRDP
jgi:hypothetical protein